MNGARKSHAGTICIYGDGDRESLCLYRWGTQVNIILESQTSEGTLISRNTELQYPAFQTVNHSHSAISLFYVGRDSSDE